MSRTHHHRFSTPDPWRIYTQRPQRQARPAGRIKVLVEAEMAAEGMGAPEGEES